jgi:hypothetical protein
LAFFFSPGKAARGFQHGLQFGIADVAQRIAQFDRDGRSTGGWAGAGYGRGLTSPWRILARATAL